MVSIGLAIALGGCAVAGANPGAKPGANPGARQAADAQRSAIFECKRQLGISGPAVLDTEFIGGQGTRIQIKPAGQVTPALAAQINSCAAGGGAHDFGPATQGHPVAIAPQPSFQKYGIDPVYYAPAATYAPTSTGHHVGGSCVPGLGVMQRGTLICPGH